MKTRSKFLSVFSVIILTGCLLWLIVSGAAAFFKRGSKDPAAAAPGEVCEFTIDVATQAFSVKNSVNFIPTGKEYYYITGTMGEGLTPFLVRAKPKWFEKNFGGGTSGGTVKVTGKVTRLHYKITDEVRKLNNGFADGTSQGDTLNMYYFIDTRYREFGLMRMLSGLGLIAVGALGFLFKRSGMPANKAAGVPLALFAVAVGILTVYTLSVGGAF